MKIVLPTASLALAALLTAAAGCPLLAQSARQAGAERSAAGAATLDLPGGWTGAERDATITLTPPGVPRGAMCKVLLPPAEQVPARAVAPWFDAAWRAFKAGYGDVQETPRQTASRGDQVIFLIAASMSDASGQFIYAMFSAVARGDRVQPLLFMAGSTQRYEQRGDQYTALVNSFVVTDASVTAGPPLAAGGWKKVLGSPTATVETRAAPAAAQGTAAGLVGDWGDSQFKVAVFHDPRTGGLADPPGNIESWSLAADGTYQHGSTLQSMLFTCRSTLIMWDEGTWSAENNVLVAQAQRALVRSINTCGSADTNYQRPARAETRRLRFRFERGTSGAPVLVLSGPNRELRAARH